MSHVAIPGPRNRFQWDPAAAREIISFGKWIFISTLFTFVAMRIDFLLLARWVPLDVLGVYSISVLLSEVPQRLTTPGFHRPGCV